MRPAAPGRARSRPARPRTEPALRPEPLNRGSRHPKPLRARPRGRRRPDGRRRVPARRAVRWSIPGAPAGATGRDGVIVAVRSEGLDRVNGFDLRTIDQGTLAFTLGDLENGAEFPPGHLVEHQATAQPVRVSRACRLALSWTDCSARADFSGASVPRCSIVIHPRIALSGVRSSCDTMTRTRP